MKWFRTWRKIVSALLVFSVLVLPMITGNAFAATLLTSQFSGNSVRGLEIQELDQNSIPKSLISKCLADQDVEKLIQRNQEDGYVVGQELKARIVEIPNLEQEIEQVMLPIYDNSTQVGGLIYVDGPKATWAYSLIQKEDIFIAEYIENGEYQFIVFSNEGEVISSSDSMPNDVTAMLDITCEEVCGVICAGGVAGALSKCIKTCTKLGPATAWCTGLCTIIGGLGCLVGCDTICSYF